MHRQFPFRFAGYRERITDDMLNSAYGEYGRTFKSEDEAWSYSYKKPNAYVCRIKNYHDKDVIRVQSINDHFCKVEVVKEARPYTVGWLVSYVPPKSGEINVRKIR